MLRFRHRNKGDPVPYNDGFRRALKRLQELSKENQNHSLESAGSDPLRDAAGQRKNNIKSWIDAGAPLSRRDATLSVYPPFASFAPAHLPLAGSGVTEATPCHPAHGGPRVWLFTPFPTSYFDATCLSASCGAPAGLIARSQSAAHHPRRLAAFLPINIPRRGSECVRSDRGSRAFHSSGR